MRALLVLWLLAAAGCGVKGPPRPPLEALAVPPEAPAPPPPDAGAAQ